MAIKDRIVEIAYRLKDEFTKRIPKITGSIKQVGDASDRSTEKIEANNKKAGRSFGRLSSAVSKTRVAIVAIGAVIFGAARAITKWTQAAAAQERAEIKLATTLRNLTGATEDQIKALQEQAAALQQVTGYGDETIISAQAMLGTFQLTADEIATLTPRLLDMAEASRKLGNDTVDLETLSIALGKAFTSGVGALSRYGVAMSDAQKEAFKLADQQGKVQLLAEILDGNFQGLAAAVGNSYEGAVRKADAAQGDFLETLGRLFTQNRLWIQFQNTITRAWQSMSDGITSNAQTIGIYISGLAGTLTATAGAIRVAWNEVQLVFRATLLVITETAEGAARALSRVSFGDTAESFRAAADALEGRVAVLRKNMREDVDDIREGVELFTGSLTELGDEAPKAAGAVGGALANMNKGSTTDEITKDAQTALAAIKELRDELNKPPEKPDADLTILDAKQSVIDAGNAADEGDAAKAIELADKARQQIEALNEQGKGTKQYLTTLADLAAQVVERAATETPNVEDRISKQIITANDLITAENANLEKLVPDVDSRKVVEGFKAAIKAAQAEAERNPIKIKVELPAVATSVESLQKQINDQAAKIR